MDENPLLDYLTTKRLVPYACIEPWLAYILGMISLVTAVMAILNIDQRIIPADEVDWWRFGLIVAWPVALLPLIAVLISTGLAARTTRSDAYRDALSSTISNRDMAWGMVGAAVYWLRGWLVWLFGYTPIYMGAAGFAHHYSGASFSQAVGYGVLQGLGVWGLCGAAIVLGVLAGLGRGWLALVALILVLLLIGGIVTAQLLLMLTPVPLIVLPMGAPTLVTIGVAVPLGIVLAGWPLLVHWVRGSS